MSVNVAAEAAYTYVFVLVNDSVDPQLLGRVNGISQTLVATMRMIGILTRESLYTLSKILTLNLLHFVPFALQFHLHRIVGGESVSVFLVLSFRSRHCNVHCSSFADNSTNGYILSYMKAEEGFCLSSR